MIGNWLSKREEQHKLEECQIVFAGRLAYL